MKETFVLFDQIPSCFSLTGDDSVFEISAVSACNLVSTGEAASFSTVSEGMSDGAALSDSSCVDGWSSTVVGADSTGASAGASIVGVEVSVDMLAVWLRKSGVAFFYSIFLFWLYTVRGVKRRAFSSHSFSRMFFFELFFFAQRFQTT